MDKEKRILIYMTNGHDYIVHKPTDNLNVRLRLALVKNLKHFNINPYDAHAITHAITNTNGCRADRVSEININLDNIVSIEFDGWDTK